MLGCLIATLLVVIVGFLSAFSVCESYFFKIRREYPEILTRFSSYLLIYFKIAVENLLNSRKVWIQKMGSHPQNNNLSVKTFLVPWGKCILHTP